MLKRNSSLSTLIQHFVCGCFLCVFGLFPAFVAGQSLKHPALMSTYRGQKNTVLAHSPQGNITESDLCIFLLMTGLDDAHLVEQYRNEKNPRGRRILRARLEEALEQLALVRHLASAGKTHGSDPSTVIDLLRQQILLLPLHELLWIDRFLVPQIKIVQADVWKRYGEVEKYSLSPKQAQVRYIFMKVNAPQSEEGASEAEIEAAWSSVKAKLEDVRSELMTVSLSMEDAARSFSEAPSAEQGGLIPAFSRGTHFEEFEQEAFILGPGEFSRVIRGPNGFYLLQGEQAPARFEIKLQEVESEIRRELFFNQLKGRYVFELERLRRKSPANIRGMRIADLQDEDMLLKLKGLELNRREAMMLFPQFISDDFRFTPERINGDLWRIADLQKIKLYNLKNGLADGTLLNRARIQAKQLLAAESELNRLVALDFDKIQNKYARFMRTRPEAFSVHPAVKSEGDETDVAVSMSPTVAVDADADYKKRKSHFLTPLRLHLGRSQPLDAFQLRTFPRFTLILIQTIDGPRMSPPRARHELERMQKHLQDSLDSISGKSLGAIGSQWPDLFNDPSLGVPRLLEQQLLKESNEYIGITLWNSTQPIKALPKKFRADAERIRAHLVKWSSEGKRFLEADLSDTSLMLPYIEQVDYFDPAVNQLARGFLGPLIIETLRNEVMDKILERDMGPGGLQVLIR